MQDAAVVPAVSVPSTHACLRSLHERGVGGVVVSEHESPAVACSRYCAESVRVPSPAESVLAYRDALLALAERDDVRTVIPVRDEDVYVLSRYREAFAEHVGVPVPSFDGLRRVHDRVELFDAAETAGVPTPETKLLTECDDWSRRWIVKGRYALLADGYLESEVPTAPDSGSGTATGDADGRTATGDADGRSATDDAGGRTVTDGRREGASRPPSTKFLLPGADPDVDALVSEMGHVPLVQEFVDDPSEYAFFAIYDRGDPLATFQHRQVRGFDYGGGPSAFRKSVVIPQLEREGRKLLDHLDWHGPAMVEFKRDPDTGEFRLMEINPRFWSSLPFTVYAGADVPWYYWLLATDRADRISPGYDVGKASHLAKGELFYLYSVLFGDNPLVERPSFPSALGAVLRSVVEYPHFDYLDASDPCPAAKYYYDHLREAVLKALSEK